MVRGERDPDGLRRGARVLARPDRSAGARRVRWWQAGPAGRSIVAAGVIVPARGNAGGRLGYTSGSGTKTTSSPSIPSKSSALHV